MYRVWTLVLGAMAAGCSASPHFGVERAAIIGGTRDSADPAVVLLISYPSDQSTFYTCTASVIAPTVLLTAAHCVDAGHHPGYSFGAFLGDDASAFATAAALAPELVPSTAVHVHPSYDTSPPFTADLAIVELTAAVTATPLALAANPPVAGQAARLVGYGQTQYGQFNDTKYEAATTVAMVPGDDTVIVGDAQYRSCVGDSGGPALVEESGREVVLGVDSYTDTTGCVDPSHYRRVDQYGDFLSPFLPSPSPVTGPDAGSLADLATVADAATLADLATAADLATRRDLATRADLAGPAGAAADASGNAPHDSGCTIGAGAAGAQSSSRWAALLALALLVRAASSSRSRWRARDHLAAALRQFA